MKVTQLQIDGAWLIESPVYPDLRGVFREWFTDELNGDPKLPKFQVRQANTSVSNFGVIRGIHYSEASLGQSKIVTCTFGTILDVIVDLRPNSKSYGENLTIELDEHSGKSLFISSGLGHGFQALEDRVAVTYLLDKKYSPNTELVINPIDPNLAIPWKDIPAIISDKDTTAPQFSSKKPFRGGS